MSDRYQQFTQSPIGKFVVSKLGLPRPAPLRRYEPGQPLLTGPALVGAAEGGRLGGVVRQVLASAGAEARASSSTVDSSGIASDNPPAALVFDATGIQDPIQLRQVYEFFHPVIKRVAPSGRVVVLGTSPESVKDHERIAQRALEGFVRSVGKELRRGATAQLIYVAEGAEDQCESTLRFILSAKSAFVDGQVIRVGSSVSALSGPVDWEKPLTGKVALVTGAAQGIGAAIAEVLARDGAHIVALDIPAQGEQLSTVANNLRGSSLQLDITAKDASAKLVDYLTTRHGGVDVVVHNAGITRDRTLGNMDSVRWDAVLSVNLLAQIEINRRLMEDEAINKNGRIIGVSSIAGIAGNAGQTNYATSKAGVIGVVDALAPLLAEREVTVNAVAPGFIETKMTAAVPLMIREVGRRFSSLAQGGLPIDVAETISWFANPASAGVSGNVVRVCGQAFLGA